MLSGKKSGILILCLSAILLLVVFSTDLKDFNISYKNNEMETSIPKQEISQEIQEWNFNLPVLYIKTNEIEKLLPQWTWTADGPALPEREETFVDIYVFNEEINNLSNKPTNIYYSAAMKLRGRTSSYMQLKKPFSIEFKDSENNTVDYPFLNFNAESDFVLHAPYIDRSLIRNYMAYTLQNQLLEYAPKAQFVEVFLDTDDEVLNKADYVGVYLVVEKIKKGKNRINIKKYKIADNADNQFEKGGNYIYKLDSYEEGYDTAIRLNENKFGNTYSLVYPKADIILDNEEQSIFNEIETYEQALYNGTDEEFAKYYDIEEFAKCVLLTELMKNFEGFSSSLYFYRAEGEKIKVLQWDFDIGTGNIDYEADLSNALGFDVLNKEYLKPFLSHQNFKDELVNQWKILRQTGGILSEENIIKLLEDAEIQLEGAWQANDEIYPEMFTGYVFGNKENEMRNSYEERQYIRTFLIERGRWLDENIEQIYNF